MRVGSLVTTAWRDLGLDGLHLWRGSANKFNKQSRANDKVSSSRLRLGRGAENSHRKKEACYETFNRDLDFDVFFDKRPKLRNMDMRFGTWNIRSLYRAGSLVTVLKYK
jgi:hypothetical protein